MIMLLMIIGDNVNVYNLNLSHLSIHQLLSNILYCMCIYSRYCYYKTAISALILLS